MTKWKLLAPGYGLLAAYRLQAKEANVNSLITPHSFTSLLTWFRDLSVGNLLFFFYTVCLQAHGSKTRILNTEANCDRYWLS